MARKKNSTFQGSSAFDVDVDALTYRRVWENIAGDLALVADKATGEHGETEVIDHSGVAGRGSLLGVPIINQFIGRTLHLNYDVGGAAGSKDSGKGPTWLYSAWLFISPGEGDVVVHVGWGGSSAALEKAVCYVRDTAAFAVVGDDRVPLTEVRGYSGANVMGCRIYNLTPGLHLLFLEVDTSEGDIEHAPFDLVSFTASPMRQRRRGGAIFPRPLDDSPFGVTAPGAAQGFVPVDYDEAAFSDGVAINGHMVFRHNRLINALYEYITGWRAGGNAARTLVDHDGAAAPDGTNPARSRALAHTRSLYANEPEIAWPVWSECFGAFKVDGGLVVDAASPPTGGMLKWFAPWRRATTTAITALQNMRRLRATLPDFQTTSSRLKWAVLAGTDGGDVTQWVAHVSAGGATATANFAVIPGTGGKLAMASGSALAFVADVETDIIVGLSRASPIGAVDECVLIAACMYFEP